MPELEEGVGKGRKHRSPTYPGINLQQAVKRAAELYAQDGRNPASFRAAVTHWKYSEKSSGALITIAALKSFGLVNELESKNGRTFQLSPLGLKIIADKRPESPERDAAIREAALLPKIHAELWRKYNGNLPSDAELQYRLENDWHFNVNAINPFIRELRDTIAYAGLKQSDKIGDAEVQDGENDEERDLDAQDVEQEEREERPHLKPKKHMQEFVVPLSGGSKAIFHWPSALTSEDIDDLKDSLKIIERKISRSAKRVDIPETEEAAE
jgi:hypothetical protein